MAFQSNNATNHIEYYSGACYKKSQRVKPRNFYGVFYLIEVHYKVSRGKIFVKFHRPSELCLNLMAKTHKVRKVKKKNSSLHLERKL